MLSLVTNIILFYVNYKRNPSIIDKPKIIPKLEYIIRYSHELEIIYKNILIELEKV